MEALELGKQVILLLLNNYHLSLENLLRFISTIELSQNKTLESKILNFPAK